ncbi:phosphate ABC transporter substrate-binding protein [Halovibrio sp. HP20-50]|uniref:phosphate ABC transporter substrate-binding protein n=1 Tax=Halovibrio sp. HP20-59 TaxID=3080275 RepID=UPI00294B7276|nr:phosphate ABC transporter substrate-binding protein [Halovibrio sp. HP20-59]MEA2117559.1 phosphate ABC transporter substrate-binding protein [Halovibrio sp. HP20-59]
MSTRLMVNMWGLLFSLLAGSAGAEVVVVVSAQNPTKTLSHAELGDIYLGRLSRFPDGTAVVPVDQRETSPAYTEFYRYHLEKTPTQIKAHWSKLIFTGRGQPPARVANDTAMANAIAVSSRAIGYLDSTIIDERLRVVAIE